LLDDLKPLVIATIKPDLTNFHPLCLGYELVATLRGGVEFPPGP